MNEFPVDKQDILIKIESWMTTALAGQIKISGISTASSGAEDVSFAAENTETISLIVA